MLGAETVTSVREPVMARGAASAASPRRRSHARARAIFSGNTAELVIFPQELRLQVSSGSSPIGSATTTEIGEGAENTPPAGGGFSAQLSEELTLEMVDVNLTEYKDAEEARVRFFPNGTADVLTVVLQWQQRDWRKISVDMVTGMAEMEVIKIW